jgi:hypothetical protein
MMLVQINSDNQIKASEAVIADLEADVRRRLDRYADRLTRVELHLRDLDAGGSSSNDKQCTIEARPVGLDPLTATAAAATVALATSEATAKLLVVLERAFGKQTSRKGH